MSKPSGDRPGARRLATAVATARSQQQTVMSTATVTSVTPLEVTWRGATGVPCSRLGSYTPAIGHVVLLALIDHQPVILGRIV